MGGAVMPISADLVRRARTGDRTAHQRLFEEHRQGLYGYLLTMTREPDVAADLTSETFARALGGLARLRHPAAFEGWLYRIATNLVRDRVAAARVDSLDGVDDELPDPAPAPEAALESAELSARVRAAVDALSPEHRAVVVLHHLRGLDVETTARALRLREGTVKSRLARARTVLRRRLSAYLEA